MQFTNPGLIMALILWFVAYIFIINGLNMLGKISGKDCGVWNLIIGGWMFILLIICIVFQLFSAGTWITVGGVFLFTFTYIGIGFTNLLNLDGRGLGWYCLLVALITPFVSQMNFGAGDWKFGIIWLIWGVLWFVFFLILGLGKKALAGRTFGTIIILVGIFTLWIPGYAMLRGWW
jgi:hypothetical protein